MSVILKKCIECNEVTDNFYKGRTDCKDCKKKRSSNNYHKEHERNLIKNWIKQGMVEPKDKPFKDWYKEYSESYECYICKTIYDQNIIRKRKVLHHDHRTGLPKSIMCSYCNLNVIDKIEHNQLQNDYDESIENYRILEENYNELLINYNELLEKYNKLNS